MTPEEQRALAIKCGAKEVDEYGWCENEVALSPDSLSAYTAAVEAKKQAELDKANARIAQLENSLSFYVAEDETNEGGDWEEINKFWLDGKRKAIRLLESSNSPDTWLSEHDKAVEVKLLQILSKKVDERGNPDRTLGDDIIDMLKARK